MIEKHIELKRNGIRLTGMLFIPNSGAKYPAVIIAHGLPSTPLPVEQKGYDILGRNICNLGVIAIIFNFSGCSGSSGFYSIGNEIKDLELVLNYILKLREVDKSRLAFLAFSAGTIPTIYFIAQQNQSQKKYPKLIIICACPADLSSVKMTALRLGFRLANQSGFIRLQESYEENLPSEMEEFMPIRWIEHIAIPKYIVHGAKDRVVPVDNAYSLFEYAKDPKELIILKDAEHHLRQDPNAIEKILNIIKKELLSNSNYQEKNR